MIQTLIHFLFLIKESELRSWQQTTANPFFRKKINAYTDPCISNILAKSSCPGRNPNRDYIELPTDLELPSTAFNMGSIKYKD